ncbi:hypothetical protein DGM85_20585 [Xanthomonas phaseoli pv. phaseoli]|nr:hypothetical protein DGM85_20585 [Xanthomonas phaseoli pv. phaseoli]
MRFRPRPVGGAPLRDEGFLAQFLTASHWTGEAPGIADGNWRATGGGALRLRAFLSGAPMTRPPAKPAGAR